VRRAALADPGRFDELVTGVDAAYARGATYPLASALQAAARARGAAARPAQPTIAIWGGRDRTHRGTRHDELYPGAPVVVLAAAGHFPELEDVAGFTAVMDAFL